MGVHRRVKRLAFFMYARQCQETFNVKASICFSNISDSNISSANISDANSSSINISSPNISASNISWTFGPGPKVLLIVRISGANDKLR